MPKQKPEATPDRVAKLPKWAQDHITDLERTADRATARLEQYVNENQEGKIVVSDYTNGDHHDVKIPAEKVTFVHAGVWLQVKVYSENQIDLSWGPGHSMAAMGDVCFIPTAYQQARLVHPDNCHKR